MMSENNLELVKDLIAAGEDNLPEAIRILLIASRGSTAEANVLVLSGRFNNYIQNRIRGLDRPDDLTREKNNIAREALAVLDALQKGPLPLTTDLPVCAVNRKTIRRDPAFSSWQRLFFRYQPLKKKRQVALAQLGLFDAVERKAMLRGLKRILTVRFTENLSMSASQPFVKHFSQALGSSRNDGNLYLLLGETGAGKSVAMLSLFLDLACSTSRYKVLFADAGAPLERILSIEGAENTVLLLDGMDESPEMLRNPDAYFARLENGALRFAKVLLSCRTQFFKTQADERSETSTYPPKRYRKVYMGLLDEDAVKLYLSRRYPIGSPEYGHALEIARTSGQTFFRPLLLQYLADVFEHKDSFQFYKWRQGQITHFEIFQVVVNNWLDREEALLQEKIAGYRDQLDRFLSDLALDVFYQGSQNYIHYINLAAYARDKLPQISEAHLRDRSLLRRNENGEYNFAHRTLKEFYFAKLLYEGRIAEHEFPFDRYEDTEKMYREMAELAYARFKKHNHGRVNFHALQTQGLPTPLVVFSHLEQVPLNSIVSETFEALILKCGLSKGELDFLTDLAVKYLHDGISHFRDERILPTLKTYRVDMGQLLKNTFFFGKDGTDGYAFIHRSFAEYLCLRHMFMEEDWAAAEEAAQKFPFDKMRFAYTFRNEIRWLRLLPYLDRAQVLMDNFPLSDRDFRESGFQSYFEYTQSKVQAFSVTDFARLAHKAEGRMALRLSGPCDLELWNWIPAAESVKELDLAHNGWKGELSLAHFRTMETLHLAGNPEARLSEWPATLKTILLSDASERSTVPKDFTGQVLYKADIVRELASGRWEAPEMVEVAGGTFWMGSDEADPNAQADERPQHLVRVQDFAMGKYPVTVRQFARFVQATGYVTQAERGGWARLSYWDENTLTGMVKTGVYWAFDVYGEPLSVSDAELPVAYVTWNDAQAYCAWLSEKTGQKYHLPSEAQWEYAAIGGQRSPKHDAKGHIVRAHEYAGSDDVREVAWYWERFTESSLTGKQISTRPVGQLASNPLGLYDMSGNVWEWCADSWHADYEGAPDDGSAWLEGGVEDTAVLRGGSWYDDVTYCRAACRVRNYRDFRFNYMGFRVARAVGGG